MFNNCKVSEFETWCSVKSFDFDYSFPVHYSIFKPFQDIGRYHYSTYVVQLTGKTAREAHDANMCVSTSHTLHVHTYFVVDTIANSSE